MKKAWVIIRWFVGVLFIFSGLVKANDPYGLSYKMQEFFEAWNMHGFHDFTLSMAILMNVFEIVAGVALIVGWRTRLFSWMVLLLIIFFMSQIVLTTFPRIMLYFFPLQLFHFISAFNYIIHCQICLHLSGSVTTYSSVSSS